MEGVIKNLLIDFCTETGIDHQDPIVREKIWTLTEDIIGLMDPTIID